jgi:hypothetical protein
MACFSGSAPCELVARRNERTDSELPRCHSYAIRHISTKLAHSSTLDEVTVVQNINQQLSSKGRKEAAQRYAYRQLACGERGVHPPGRGPSLPNAETHSIPTLKHAFAIPTMSAFQVR